MTESINLAPAVGEVVFGHAVPKELCFLALLSAVSVLVSLARDWARRLGV
jgi:hypothetical protein